MDTRNKKQIIKFLKINNKKIISFLCAVSVLFVASNVKYANIVFTPFISFTIIILSFQFIFKVQGKFLLLILLLLYIPLFYFTLINNSLFVEQISEDCFITFILATIVLIKDFKNRKKI